MPLYRSKSHLDIKYDGTYIRFELIDGEKIVSCAVSAQYLAAAAREVGLQGSYHSMFMRFRQTIEIIASDKYDRGSTHPVITIDDI